MDRKRVLVITYYWPPAGGSGVQRWLKFVKYFPEFGWDPVVFVPENASYGVKDESLLKDVPAEAEVLHFPIWEPYDLFLKLSNLSGKKNKITKTSDFVSTERRTLFQKISSWIRGNIFIPDPRVGWVRPSVKFLSDLVKNQDFKAIITTGPPHSVHLIGYHLKKRNPSLRWIADFRDPWTEWDIYDHLYVTSRAKKMHRRMEFNVLTTSDMVISISPYHVNRLIALGGRRVELLTNGFDEDDFRGLTHVRTEKFTIRHIGTADELRDPRPFMKAVEQVCLASKEIQRCIQVEFIGNVNTSFVNWIKQNPLLRSITTFGNSIPHSQLIPLYGATDVLLLVLANTVIGPGNLPGKFFEYLAAGRPIVAVGPEDGDAGEIIRQVNAGAIFNPDQINSMADFICTLFEKWQKHEKWENLAVGSFSRKALTARLSQLMSTLF